MTELLTDAASAATGQLRYKLFFSVDIVGSTAFKQPFDASTEEALTASVMRAAVWRRAIETFYRVVNASFIDRWEELRDDWINKVNNNQDLVRLLFGSFPRLWKTVGDEILFWKQIEHELQMAPILDAWLHAITTIRAVFDNAEETRGLDVKATIWSAEFPLRNKQTVAVYEDTSDANASADALQILEGNSATVLQRFYDNSQDAEAPPEHVDFIGPGIDVGFRLASFSSAKKMAISLDVAYLLANVWIFYEAARNKLVRDIVIPPDTEGDEGTKICLCQTLVDERADIRDFIRNSLEVSPTFEAVGSPRDDGKVTLMDFLRVNFSGRNVLKGAIGGIKYPFFWINILSKSSLEAFTDSLYIEDGGRRPLEWKKLFRYCRRFYDDRRKFITPPIVGLEEGYTFSYNEERARQYGKLLKSM